VNAVDTLRTAINFLAVLGEVIPIVVTDEGQPDEMEALALLEAVVEAGEAFCRGVYPLDKDGYAHYVSRLADLSDALDAVKDSA
jgi:hypothetical protein